MALDGNKIRIKVHQTRKIDLSIYPWRAWVLSLSSLRAGLLKTIMSNPPNVTSLKREQLRASHVEDLPAIVPSGRIFLSVRLDKVRPKLLLILDHCGKPVLSGVSVYCRFLVLGARTELLTSQVLE